VLVVAVRDYPLGHGVDAGCPLGSEPVGHLGEDPVQDLGGPRRADPLLDLLVGGRPHELGELLGGELLHGGVVHGGLLP
jgi:hypothetical protein